MANSPTDQVWFITGSSSGFGRAFAEVLIARDNRVVATARDPGVLAKVVEPGGERAVAVELDVVEPRTVRTAVTQALDTFGRIDVLVNCAGSALGGALEEWPSDQLRSYFETNLFGAVSVMQSMLPVMRRQRSGTIVQMSSAAGVVAVPGFGAYAGAKFALEGITEALAVEVAHLGIEVVIVEPGRFRTEFNHRSAQWSPPIDDYAFVIDDARRKFEAADGHQPGDPIRGAHAVIDAIDRGSPPLRLPLGAAAFTTIRERLGSRLAELNALEPLGKDTDFA